MSFLFSLGRFLQFVGLILLPIAMAGNLAERQSVGEMLRLSVIGIGIFALGWLLQQATRPR